MDNMDQGTVAEDVSESNGPSAAEVMYPPAPIYENRSTSIAELTPLVGGKDKTVAEIMFPNLRQDGDAPNNDGQDLRKAPDKHAQPSDPQDTNWKVSDLQTPEDITIDPVIGEKMVAVGQELRLSKAAAQKLVNLQ